MRAPEPRTAQGRTRDNPHTCDDVTAPTCPTHSRRSTVPSPHVAVRQETGNQAARHLATTGTPLSSCAASSLNGPARKTSSEITGAGPHGRALLAEPLPIVGSVQVKVWGGLRNCSSTPRRTAGGLSSTEVQGPGAKRGEIPARQAIVLAVSVPGGDRPARKCRRPEPGLGGGRRGRPGGRGVTVPFASDAVSPPLWRTAVRRGTPGGTRLGRPGPGAPGCGRRGCPCAPPLPR